MDKQEKEAIIKEYALSEGDVGSVEVQVAVLSKRISELTSHLQMHKKDNSSRRGLLTLVNRRRKLLRYLNRKDHHRYTDLIKRLNIRR
jgi:small subunit ribosomal protein S15